MIHRPMKQALRFSLSIQVSPEDLDELQHVNNTVYLRYIQEAAIAHWYQAAPAEIVEAYRWVVRKHEITYFKPAFVNENLQITTWIDAFQGVTSVRHYTIHRNDDLLVEATTTWISLDATSLRPKRILTDLSPFFFLG